MSEGTTGDPADESAAPRLRGEAAWKAQRDTIEQHNAAAKKRAHDHKSASASAATMRERRLELQEEAQLQALNKRLPGRS
jgi:hypothetical protein